MRPWWPPAGPSAPSRWRRRRRRAQRRAWRALRRACRELGIHGRAGTGSGRRRRGVGWRPPGCTPSGAGSGRRRRLEMSLRMGHGRPQVTTAYLAPGPGEKGFGPPVQVVPERWRGGEGDVRALVAAGRALARMLGVEPDRLLGISAADLRRSLWTDGLTISRGTSPLPLGIHRSVPRAIELTPGSRYRFRAYLEPGPAQGLWRRMRDAAAPGGAAPCRGGGWSASADGWRSGRLSRPTGSPPISRETQRSPAQRGCRRCTSPS